MSKSVLLAFVLAASLPAQDSNSIMGFESPLGWIVNTRASSTVARTQGSLALELRGVAGLTSLTSVPVVFNTPALAGVGNTGAIFEVDASLPAQGGANAGLGSIRLLVSAPSAGLTNALLGRVDLAGLRTGIYNTLKFPIPDNVRLALGSVPFRDLTFVFLLDPGSMQGTYLFDNLRVHSVDMGTASASIRPPAGYGGSVDMVVNGAVPTAQTFDIGSVQIPQSLHLKLGQAGGTTVELALGFDGVPAFICTYMPDRAVSSGNTYTLLSCTGGFKAGDLTGANWAQLTIAGGATTQQLRAQLAKNPAGDLVGAGLIPPLPTFWGDFDGCVPSPVQGVTFTLSPSCASQAAQADQIVTSFFQQVRQLASSPDWLVTPTPEFARRTDTGDSHNPQALAPSRLDPPFDQSGHMNNGGDWDAYWRLNGNLSTETKTDGQSTTHFEATFGAHAVLDGYDVDVVRVNTTADTNSGSLTGTAQPSLTASLRLFLFGQELSAGQNLDASIPIHKNLASGKREINAPPIHVWIFSITLGATAQVDVDLAGTVAASGFTLGLTPHAALGAHATGSVDLGIASGGVDVEAQLIDIKTPLSVHAQWSVATAPQSCSAGLNTKAHGDSIIGSLGGEIKLVASFGPCPFCDHESWTLFSWDPLLTHTKAIFDLTENLQLVPLPASLCQQPVTVTILAPSTNVISGVPYDLQGMAVGAGPFDCSSFTWSLTPPAQPGELTLINNNPCQVVAQFAPPIPPATTTSRTLTLMAKTSVLDAFRRSIPQTGSTSKLLIISKGSDGPHITSITPQPKGQTLPAQLENTTVVYHIPPLTAALSLRLDGSVSGSRGTIDDWIVTDGGGAVLHLGGGPTAHWDAIAYGSYGIAMVTSGGTVRMRVDIQP